MTPKKGVLFSTAGLLAQRTTDMFVGSLLFSGVPFDFLHPIRPSSAGGQLLHLGVVSSLHSMETSGTLKCRRGSCHFLGAQKPIGFPDLLVSAAKTATMYITL